MTTAEKARAYDEALEVMRQWIAPCHTKEQLDALKKSVFPELRESEDERMMRVIGLALTDVPEERFTSLGTTLKDCLAYLEKQKEQKPFNVCEQCPYYKDCPDYNEKKQEWSEEDSAHLTNAILSAEKEWGTESRTAKWLKALPERFNLQPKQERSEEDERILRRIIERLSVDKNIGLFEFKEMETFLNSYRP